MAIKGKTWSRLPFGVKGNLDLSITNFNWNLLDRD